MLKVSTVFVVFVISCVFAHEADFVIEPEFAKVTCGSSIKLKHWETNYRLHSHQVNYGSGSGQQSVTGFMNFDDPNSYWVVKGGRTECTRGTPIGCGELIRLQHGSTKKYLHSHNHVSPLSGGQEVSAYEGQDEGDIWKVLCLEKNDKKWTRENKVRLLHEISGKYLSGSARHIFRNPIPGQIEISGTDSVGANEVWAATEGIYFPDSTMVEE